MPVAQTLVLRRVLTGGISTNSGRRVFSRHPVRMTCPFGVVVLERCGEGTGGFVFGTLLGPEATGPVVTAFGCGVRDLCFWFPGCTERARVCVGCVVRGCCLRTT